MVIIQCATCVQQFHICRSCFRGHKYCSQDCKVIGYRRCLYKAKEKYESSEEARLDHRDRSRRYRIRKSRKIKLIQIVTDKSSENIMISVKSSLDKNCCIVCNRFLFNKELGIENLELQFLN